VTNLQGVNLQHANLGHSYFDEADLTDANLIEAKNISVEQLSEAKTLYNAKLDGELMEQVKKCCPHLSERSKEEIEQSRNN
jgi:uncharacterized protein YjbI with pentapeptide repeats